MVYPGGVPYPEELQSQTAVIANEVWLYVDGDGDLLGMHWWPDAMRRPIASVPVSDFTDEDLVDPAMLGDHLDFEFHLPTVSDWTAAAALCPSRLHATVFLVRDAMPDPLNEMLVFEGGGLALSASREEEPFDVQAFVRKHAPPYRQVRVGARPAVGREPGRALGPQTWPWPGELRWSREEVTYELKGFLPLGKLQEVAGSTP